MFPCILLWILIASYYLCLVSTASYFATQNLRLFESAAESIPSFWLLFHTSKLVLLLHYSNYLFRVFGGDFCCCCLFAWLGFLFALRQSFIVYSRIAQDSSCYHDCWDYIYILRGLGSFYYFSHYFPSVSLDGEHTNLSQEAHFPKAIFNDFSKVNLMMRPIYEFPNIFPNFWQVLPLIPLLKFWEYFYIAIINTLTLSSHTIAILYVMTHYKSQFPKTFWIHVWQPRSTNTTASSEIYIQELYPTLLFVPCCFLRSGTFNWIWKSLNGR